MWSSVCYDPHSRFYREDLFSAPTFKKNTEIKEQAKDSLKNNSLFSFFMIPFYKPKNYRYVLKRHIYTQNEVSSFGLCKCLIIPFSLAVLETSQLPRGH